MDFLPNFRVDGESPVVFIIISLCYLGWHKKLFQMCLILLEILFIYLFLGLLFSCLRQKVFAGAKPLLEKTLGILVEGLIDTFISLFHESKSKDLRLLDANGFCQLMLEVYFLIFNMEFYAFYFIC